MLPVSQYEALLAEVRDLRRKAQCVEQLATPLLSTSTSKYDTTSSSKAQCDISTSGLFPFDLSPANISSQMAISNVQIVDDCLNPSTSSSSLLYGPWHLNNEKSSILNKMSESSNDIPKTSSDLFISMINLPDEGSIMSFDTSSGGVPLENVLNSPLNIPWRRSSPQLEAKVDMVYSLLAMLSGQEHADMGETLLALSANPESCLAMRQSGCIPLLVQMVQSDREPESRTKASLALRNLVHSQLDEKMRKREIRIFKLLELVRIYTEAVRNQNENDFDIYALESTNASSLSNDLGAESSDRHPVQHVAYLMKLSFDELHRQAICQLGGIHTIAGLVQAEHTQHGSITDESHCILMRRYACMALTNLTFGDSGNKALLCSFRDFMQALVIQLQSPSEELRQVTASVLRNLSWRADSTSKAILREVGSVGGLMTSAMVPNKENTLKSILSALWNLSAHCTENKSEICAVEGALAFLVNMLSSEKSLAIVENSGGILRNISSQIALRDDYRLILRHHNCLQILLEQLKSPSLTVVSNACGTLWNLSAKCAEDQQVLWEMGAPTMLRSLNHSKHKMIAMGSSAALKNLLAARPSHATIAPNDGAVQAMDLPALPSLGVRKQKAILHEFGEGLSETYENIEKEECFNAKQLKKLKKKIRCDNEYDVTSDEKEHCSIEDVSDDNDEAVINGLIPRRDVGQTSLLFASATSDTQRENAKVDLNETMLEIDAIAIGDISFNLMDSMQVCSDSEKQDAEKEKAKKNFLKKAQNSVSNESTSKLSKVTNLTLKTSTPTLTNNKSMYFEQNQNLFVSPIVSITEQQKANGTSHRNIYTPSGLPRRISNARSTITKSNQPTTNEETCKVQNNIDASPFSKSDSDSITSQDVCSDSSKCNSFGAPVTDEIKIQNLLSKNDLNMSMEQNSCQNDNNNKIVNQSTKDVEVTQTEDIYNNRDSNYYVSNRMLDPDAMIESLERFTAELVSQASCHLQSNSDASQIKQPNQNNNSTWNTDSSSNDITFPSLSTAGLTYESCSIYSENKSNKKSQPQEAEPMESNDFVSINTESSMSKSTIIAKEATKIAALFQHEADELSTKGRQSPENSPKRCASSTLRRTSLPRSLLVKRALSNSINNASSAECLDESWTNLEHVNPPSFLDQVNDMDGSITSIASLPSDNKAEQVTNFQINGLVSCNGTKVRGNDTSFNLFTTTHNSIRDLDQTNPPSYFNDITDLCNSLADVASEAIGSETEIFQDCVTHLVSTTNSDNEQTTADELYTIANSETPISPDSGSSLETTPKKSKKTRSERFKTYTVSPEVLVQASNLSPLSDKPSTKLTPKERRRLDQSRYETRTLSLSDLPEEPKPKNEASSIRKSFIQKRAANSDRFKTQTISTSCLPSNCTEPKTEDSLLPPVMNDTDFEQMLQKEANFMVKTLKEARLDDSIDCENVSLVSNDDDSDALNYRTYRIKKSSPLAKALAGEVEPEQIPSEQEENDAKAVVKPKILKPDAKTATSEDTSENVEQAKGIRGKRKALYKSSPALLKNKSIKPVKTTTAIPSTPKTIHKPPVTSSGYGLKKVNISNVKVASPASKPLIKSEKKQELFLSKDRTTLPGSSSPQKSRIPMIPKSATLTDGFKTPKTMGYVRSTSADGRETGARIPNVSLPRSAETKIGTKKGLCKGAVEKAGCSSRIPPVSPAKKQITSKIESLLKKIEETKSKQVVKKDTRKWIGTEENDGIVLRKDKSLQRKDDDDEAKRVSRLGSFIVMEDGESSK